MLRPAVARPLALPHGCSQVGAESRSESRIEPVNRRTSGTSFQWHVAGRCNGDGDRPPIDARCHVVDSTKHPLIGNSKIITRRTGGCWARRTTVGQL